MSDAAPPERLDRFMARANATYYAARDPFADFATAPEIAQAFGEILGAWAAVMWQSMGAPDPVLLVEAGPGRGTLMADLLRLVSRVAPAFHRAVRLHLVETSPRLRAVQAAALAGSPGEAPPGVPSGAQPVWHDRIDTLPDGPLILLANEFLDALPIRQLERTAAGWRERFVSGERFVLRDTALSPPHPEASPDGVAEICEPALRIAAWLGDRLCRSGGVALFLDYGRDRPGGGDTLQALREGRFAPPLRDPGQADLTAHVDFPALRRAAVAAGAASHGPVGQGAFLAALGLFERTARLARGRPPAEAATLLDAAHRLAAPERMGRLFKAMALCHPSLPVPPGFASAPG